MKNFLFCVLVFYGITENLYAGTAYKILLAQQKPKPTLNKTKFNVNLDLSGYYRQNSIVSNFEKYGYLKCTSSVYVMYRMGNFELGLGGRFGLEKTINSRTNEIGKIVNSFAIGLNYNYGRKSMIQYQIIGRTFYNFYSKDWFPGRLRSEGFSTLLGWGPKVNFSNFQISPVFNLDMVSRNTNLGLGGDYFIKSGFLLNLSIPIK